MLDRVYPALGSTGGYPDAFFVTVCACLCPMGVCGKVELFVIFLQESEFSLSLGVSNLSLNNHKVLIVWKWTWEDDEAEIEARSR